MVGYGWLFLSKLFYVLAVSHEVGPYCGFQRNLFNRPSPQVWYFLLSSLTLHMWYYSVRD